MIHAARLAASQRLQRVAHFLRNRGATGATTREIVYQCEVVAVNSIAAELRAQGIPVSCRYDGRSMDGASVYRYRLGKGWPRG